MDPLSQIALGAAVSVAALGTRTRPWKAAVWGAIAGTLPDLDILIDYGDPVRNMTFHRAESHALAYLTLLAPLLAWIATRAHGEADRFRHWLLALWLALVTHPLLDLFTIYGTQLLLPFTDHPFGVGSIFVIDPLYTLPLAVGVIAASTRRLVQRGLVWNRWGLILSSLYLGWSLVAQTYVTTYVRDSLRAQGIRADRLLVTPTPFNTLLWRVVVLQPGRYQEGFYALADGRRPIRMEAFPRDERLASELAGQWAVDRMAWFTHGFYRVQARDGRAYLADLRMGQEPNYVFEFALARRANASPRWEPIDVEAAGSRGDVRTGLAWLVRRVRGEDVPPPR